MSILRRLRAKQKREAEEAEQRRVARLAKKVARAAAKADGLADLPLEVALAIESNPALLQGRSQSPLRMIQCLA
jgi:hypothetical protein